MAFPKTGRWAAFFAVMMSATPAFASQNSLTGSIAGVVSNALGVPQMGASVLLFNHLERQVAKVLTDERGTFQFDSLPADHYNVRITLLSFLPAIRNNISVQPGVRQILSINMAGVLSTIELVYSLPLQQGLMSDDWKWTLRSSMSTRPVLRVLDKGSGDLMRQLRASSGMFTDTTGVVKLSAGDMPAAPTLGSQPDLGTAFALATSVHGANRVGISGNVGYGSASGNPAAGFRTSFSRQTEDGRSPELAVTMRQIFLAGRVGGGLVSGASDSVPVLRTMSLSLNDQVQLGDSLLVSYGGTLESVQFLQRLNYFSPYVRLSYDLDHAGVLEFGYSSGLPPTQLYEGVSNAKEAAQQQELSGLTMFPRVSVRGGTAQLQRAQNFELGYHKQAGSRTFRAAAYRESLTNAALTAVDADGVFGGGDLLPDLFSTASIFNAGHYWSVGYMASLSQNLNENWTVTLGYGNNGVLEAGRDHMMSNDPGELRSALRVQRRHLAVTRIAGYIPQTGTRFTTGYQFMNGRALTPGHFYMTEQMNPAQGLNVQVRQPIPTALGLGGRLEATAEIRNILAQGYQPITLGDGRRLQLVHSPRALRGGLAFIF
ncbi:MAG: TonB-dependent receptor [Bryobacterales bacterium]|nr:TonB-dependent receptor [Bryobacterales bacterium]